MWILFTRDFIIILYNIKFEKGIMYMHTRVCKCICICIPCPILQLLCMKFEIKFAWFSLSSTLSCKSIIHIGWDAYPADIRSLILWVLLDKLQDATKHNLVFLNIVVWHEIAILQQTEIDILLESGSFLVKYAIAVKSDAASLLSR